MVTTKSDCHEGRNSTIAVTVGNNAFVSAADRQNTRLRRVYDRREAVNAIHSQIGYRKRAAHELVGLQSTCRFIEAYIFKYYLIHTLFHSFIPSLALTANCFISCDISLT